MYHITVDVEPYGNRTLFVRHFARWRNAVSRSCARWRGAVSHAMRNCPLPLRSESVFRLISSSCPHHHPHVHTFAHLCTDVHNGVPALHKSAPHAPWLCTNVQLCVHNCTQPCPTSPVVVHKCTQLCAHLCTNLPHNCAEDCPTWPMVVHKCTYVRTYVRT